MALHGIHGISNNNVDNKTTLWRRRNKIMYHILAFFDMHSYEVPSQNDSIYS